MGFLLSPLFCFSCRGFSHQLIISSVKPCSSVRESFWCLEKENVNIESQSAKANTRGCPPRRRLVRRSGFISRNSFSHHNLFYDFFFFFWSRIEMSSTGSFFSPSPGTATVVFSLQLNQISLFRRKTKQNKRSLRT